MSKEFTYGLEIELSDVIRNSEPLGENMSWGNTEYDVVNSDGTATDPTGKTHLKGGEVNTLPGSIDHQVELFTQLVNIHPEATINHRSHLHCHISYPGLADSLEDQKKILKYIKENSETLLDFCFRPTKHPDMNTSAWRYQISDMTIMPDWKYDFCMAANTTKEFKESHQKVTDGRILPQTTRRFAVNLFSIHKHGTIEMRCLFPTLDSKEVKESLELLRDLITESLNNNPTPLWVLLDKRSYSVPKERVFNEFIELGWQENNYKK